MKNIGIFIPTYNEESRILDVIESAKLISNDLIIRENGECLLVALT